jgi:hypothetical protein
MGDDPAVVDMLVALEILGPGLAGDVLGLETDGLETGQIHLEVALVVGEHQGATRSQQPFAGGISSSR